MYVSLDSLDTVRSGSVSADALLSFDPSLTRLKLLLLLYTQRYAAAAGGSRSSTLVWPAAMLFDLGRCLLTHGGRLTLASLDSVRLLLLLRTQWHAAAAGGSRSIEYVSLDLLRYCSI